MKKNIFKFAASTVVLAVLAACGGGGSESSSPSAPVATTPITGTAAEGAAISGAAVTAKCVSGNASTTTAADGSFSLPTADLTAPCMLEVTFGSPAQKLHSMATAAGRTNITPITELATALAFSNSVLSSLFGTVTGEQLKQAATALPGASQQALTALTAKSLTLPTGFDPISGPLSPPAAGQTSGDVHDQLLDSLKVKLNSTGQTVQSWVSSAVAPTPTPTPTPVGGGSEAPVGLASTYHCSATGSGAASGTVIIDTAGHVTLNFQDIMTGVIYTGTGTVASNGAISATSSGSLGSIQGTVNYTGTFAILPGAASRQGAGQWVASTGTSGSWFCAG